MTKYRLLVLALFVLAIGALPLGATTQIYDNDFAGWEAAVFYNYQEEHFSDAILNDGLSVTTDQGYVKLPQGVWHDALNCPGYDVTTTTWHFDAPIDAFGGTWNPGIPGGPGAGILVKINGSWITVGEIPNNYINVFWGFVSDVPFTDVMLQYGSLCNGAWTETYEMDDMVYSGLTNYVTGGGKIGDKKPQWTFGGNVGFARDGTPIGQFQINDHVNGVAYHTTEISYLTFYGSEATTPDASHNTALFKAEFRGNDGSTKIVEVIIEDLNENREKLDTIALSGGLTLAKTKLDGGNFQVHELLPVLVEY